MGTTAFEYHVDGYLDIASCQPYDRDVAATTTAGSASVSIQGIVLDESYVGRYIYLEDAWHRILYVRDNGQTIEIDSSMTQAATAITMIAVMNRIELEGDNMSLTSFELEFTPMLR